MRSTKAWQQCSSPFVITVDADCWIWKDGIQNLVGRRLADPANTRAVAGAILIRNSRQNWLTKAQEWDYFLGIAAIKRIQSLFQGTLGGARCIFVVRPRAHW